MKGPTAFSLSLFFFFLTGDRSSGSDENLINFIEMKNSIDLDKCYNLKVVKIDLTTFFKEKMSFLALVTDNLSLLVLLVHMKSKQMLHLQYFTGYKCIYIKIKYYINQNQVK